MICDFLKKETQQFHSEAERALGAVRIFDSNYTKEEYIRLLTSLYYAHYGIESALSNFESEFLKVENLYTYKYNLLYQDLKKMGVDVDNSSVQKFEINDLTSAIGSIYVLKGSEMGTSVIYKHLQRFEFIKDVSIEFYSLETEIFLKWKDFCLTLDAAIYNFADKEDLNPIKNEILEAAKNTYMRFIQCSLIK